MNQINVDTPGSTRFEQAAAVVRRLYSGTPIKRVTIEAEMGIGKPSAQALLMRAKRNGLLACDKYEGWTPVTGKAT